MVHRLDFHVFFGDCDEAGIVFYPRFFVWFDNAFGDWTRILGLSQRSLREKFNMYATPIVDAGATFRSPARYDDLLSVHAAVVDWKERSFRVAYRAMRGDTLIAEGFEVRVFVRKDADGRFKSAPVPAAFREAMS